MELVLQVWRQSRPDAAGAFVRYEVTANPHMSFLEMLDALNEELTAKGEEPFAFEHDCREGICGSCGLVIDGTPHGPSKGTATCQLHMRKYKDGDEVWIEPWRARAFPVIKDLVVDRWFPQYAWAAVPATLWTRFNTRTDVVSVRTIGVPD